VRRAGGDGADGLPDSLRGVRFRAALIAFLLVGGLIVVFGRAVHLQVVQRDHLGALARDQYVKTIELAGRRGEIRDRNNGPLASSVEVDSIYVDPAVLAPDEAGRRAALDQLARAAGLSKERTRKLVARVLQPGSRFAWVKRRASPAMVATVKALNLPGVETVKEARRFYPQKELAAQVLGFPGADGKGLEGLERSLDDELSGQGASVRALRDARGRSLLEEESVPVDRRSGATIELTLDRTVQYLAERALAKAVTDNHAVAGTAVVLDPRTGEVLALASEPTFNPNVIPRHDQRDAVRNRAVTDSYEPGSTMKTFLLAGALDAGAINATKTFDCEGGAWRVGRHTIHDHEGYGLLTAPQILKVSSNICSGKIGLSLGGARVAEIYRAFGFGAKTGVELPGEIAGVVGDMKRDIETVTAAFGQGPITATPLQIATAMGAVANGGTLMRPYLVKRVVGPDGTVSRQGAPQAVRRVIRTETARTMAHWMEAVVSKDGTAEKAAIDGYPVAGKTGTAQKVDRGGGYGRARIASFGGFVPADDPRLVILVVIDEPQGQIYGGQVAAPAFREIATGALKVLGVPPTRALARKAEPPPAKAAPSAAPAEPAIAEGWVEADDGAPEAGAVRVPDVRGLFARAAVRRLAGAALEADLDGTGKAVTQEPPAGSFVEPGSRVTIRLQPL
jgi:cell division protein FtsI (penicillin-binding protein 3)